MMTNCTHNCFPYIFLKMRSLNISNFCAWNKRITRTLMYWMLDLFILFWKTFIWPKLVLWTWRTLITLMPSVFIVFSLESSQLPTDKICLAWFLDICIFHFIKSFMSTVHLLPIRYYLYSSYTDTTNSTNSLIQLVVFIRRVFILNTIINQKLIVITLHDSCYLLI